MKKLFSLIMALTLVSSSTFGAVLSTSTQADHMQLIGKTFDQFRYKITVENDSSNVDFQRQATGDLRNELSDLQKQGVSPQEIMSYLRNSILDTSTRQDFDLMMANVSPQSTPEEVNEMIMNFMSAKYQDGASYRGGQQAMVALAIVIGGAVTFFLIFAMTGNNGTYHNHNNCYYDYYGNYICN